MRVTSRIAPVEYIDAMPVGADRGDRHSGEATVLVGNEFATVRIELDRRGNGQRLRITDERTGRSACLDALELQALALTTHRDLAPLLDPARTLWSEAV